MALADVKGGKPASARKRLLAAARVGKDADLADDPAMARTQMALGALYAQVLKDDKRALVYMHQALRSRPTASCPRPWRDRGPGGRSPRPGPASPRRPSPRAGAAAAAAPDPPRAPPPPPPGPPPVVQLIPERVAPRRTRGPRATAWPRGGAVAGSSRHAGAAGAWRRRWSFWRSRRRRPRGPNGLPPPPRSARRPRRRHRRPSPRRRRASPARHPAAWPSRRPRGRSSHPRGLRPNRSQRPPHPRSRLRRAARFPGRRWPPRSPFPRPRFRRGTRAHSSVPRRWRRHPSTKWWFAVPCARMRPSRLMLHYRPSGSETFTAVSMPRARGVFQGVVPVEATAGKSLQFFIDARRRPHEDRLGQRRQPQRPGPARGGHPRRAAAGG